MTEELSAFEDETELPSQIIDCNMDGELDKFTFLINLEAMETKTIFFKETKNKEQRTKNYFLFV